MTCCYMLSFATVGLSMGVLACYFLPKRVNTGLYDIKDCKYNRLNNTISSSKPVMVHTSPISPNYMIDISTYIGDLFTKVQRADLATLLFAI